MKKPLRPLREKNRFSQSTQRKRRARKEEGNTLCGLCVKETLRPLRGKVSSRRGRKEIRKARKGLQTILFLNG